MAEDVSSDDADFDPNDPLASMSIRDIKPLIAPPPNPDHVLADFAKQHDLAHDQHQTTAQIFSQGKDKPKYPSRSSLHRSGMSPNLKAQFSVTARLENVIVFIFRERYLSLDDGSGIINLDPDFHALHLAVLDAAGVDFSELQQLPKDWKKQKSINKRRVRLLSAAAIHYGLDFGCLVRFLDGNHGKRG